MESTKFLRACINDWILLWPLVSVQVLPVATNGTTSEVSHGSNKPFTPKLQHKNTCFKSAECNLNLLPHYICGFVSACSDWLPSEVAIHDALLDRSDWSDK